MASRACHAHSCDATNAAAASPQRGAAIFAKASCIKCHRFGNEGGTVGPDLTAVSSRFTRRDILESILEPSRQIVEGYRPTVLATTSGRVLTGIVREESADALTLVDAEGHRQVVSKAEVEEKFVDLAGYVLPKARVQEALEKVRRLEQLADVNDLTACLRPD